MLNRLFVQTLNLARPTPESILIQALEFISGTLPARCRKASDRSAAAKKAARTKGPRKRAQAAKKAARTRARAAH